MVSVRKIGENDRVALHVRCVFVKSLVTLAKRAWGVTGESVVVTLAKRAWRVTRKAWWFWQREPGESLERVERKLEKYYEKELHLDRLVRL